MTDELTDQLKQLNHQLEGINAKNRFFVYQTKPSKFLWLNFLAGTMFTLGSLFGTAIIVSIIVYLLGKIDFIQPVTSWIENVLTSINWQKILPTPTLPGSINFSQ